MKEYKLVEHLDDCDFWSVTFPDGQVRKDMVPEIYHGCHGLVTHNGQYILLSEDDQHFQPCFIMNKEQYRLLKAITSYMLALQKDPNILYSWRIETRYFRAQIECRDPLNPLIYLIFLGKREVFSAGWLEDFSKVVNGEINE